MRIIFVFYAVSPRIWYNTDQTDDMEDCINPDGSYRNLQARVRQKAKLISLTTHSLSLSLSREWFTPDEHRCAPNEESIRTSIKTNTSREGKKSEFCWVDLVEKRWLKWRILDIGCCVGHTGEILFVISVRSLAFIVVLDRISSDHIFI